MIGADVRRYYDSIADTRHYKHYQAYGEQTHYADGFYGLLHYRGIYRGVRIDSFVLAILPQGTIYHYYSPLDYSTRDANGYSLHNCP